MFFSILMETSKSKVNCTWPVPLIWEELCFYPWSVPLICEGMCFYPWTVPLIWEGVFFLSMDCPFNLGGDVFLSMNCPFYLWGVVFLSMDCPFNLWGWDVLFLAGILWYLCGRVPTIFQSCDSYHSAVCSTLSKNNFVSLNNFKHKLYKLLTIQRCKVVNHWNIQ